MSPNGQIMFKINFFLFWGLIILTGILYVKCDVSSKKKNPGDQVLAKVENKTLHLSDVPLDFNNLSSQDSITRIQHFIKSWIKEKIVLSQAEQMIPDDWNLDKRIEDYRSSLLIHHYRQKIVKEKLDTVVTDAQLEKYYQKHKEEFSLIHPIYRAYVIILPSGLKKSSNFKSNLKNNRIEKVKEYCSQYATMAIINDSIWYEDIELLNLFQEKVFSLDDFQSEGVKKKSKDDFDYYLKIIEIRDSNEVPPLEYIEDQIKTIILNNRKNNLLKKMEEDLYEDYLNTHRTSLDFSPNQ